MDVLKDSHVLKLPTLQMIQLSIKMLGQADWTFWMRTNFDFAGTIFPT